MAREVKGLYMPQCGVMHGGRLDGWRFHFLRFIVDPLGVDVTVFARVTPPAWPFPHDMLIVGGIDYHELRAVPGERAKRLNADRLIIAAYEVDGWPVPQAWLEHSRRMRLELVQKQRFERDLRKDPGGVREVALPPPSGPLWE